MELFGWEIARKEDKSEKNVKSPIPPTNDDGSLNVAEGGVFGTYVNMDGSARTEAELIDKYREISEHFTLDMAIDEIVNEAIVEDAEEPTVELILDELDVKQNIKTRMNEEFEEVLKLLEFNNYSYEIFKRWYIDGRLYYQVLIDKDAVREGIKELRYIDPRHIKKIRKIKKETDKDSNIPVTVITDEFFMYNPGGFSKEKHTMGNATQEGIKLANDAVAYVTSGVLNSKGDMVLSYLHKAIRPLNQLKSLEDSVVIYRISRAPERRMFYIDVGNLPKAKAEQYVRDIMTKFKNKIVYDSATGAIRDDRKFMTMLEDYWLPRREGGRGTEISTLPGGQNLGEIEDVVYFQNNLYKSLNVPISRLQPETVYSLGRATEITRDEVKFGKFITRVRSKFSNLFLKLLEKQLILKGIITSEDWKSFKDNIDFRFAHDNYFEEMKQMEVMRDRLALLNDMNEYIGKYYSNEYVRKSILQQTDEEIKEEDKLIKAEKNNPQFNETEEDGFGGGFGGGNDNESDYEPKANPEAMKKPAEEKAKADSESKKEQEIIKKRKVEITKEDFDALNEESTYANLELTRALTNYLDEH